MTKPYELSCPVARALEVVGDRWTLLIVRELMLGRTRYKDIVGALPGIPPNLLSDRLRSLENEQMVSRLAPRGYELTPKGKDLAPILGGLAIWGLQHYGEAPSARAIHGDCGGTVHIGCTCNSCGTDVDPAGLNLIEARESGVTA